MTKDEPVFRVTIRPQPCVRCGSDWVSVTRGDQLILDCCASLLIWPSETKGDEHARVSQGGGGSGAA